ncbi:hypothetical protein SAMN05518849_101574 [Sphingobium sp. AP50]|uniref:hypothetical protein n=1 Tax=Sphingobium sp. AP50 TaxID=1884369 RepID=UPI0008D384CD|nr:hypothetical protein [Sphingobium sp. AP50]SEI69192.1 hypothetical protein SAMN05518849_101574 [Sphingobium sp. AP50]
MNAPFRPRDYAPADPQVDFWDDARPRADFVRDIDADLREFNIIWGAGIACGLIAVALIWWLQS